MKIERISENQIRCTLNKEDLSARQLKISELAYGSDKVKELFTEICKQASTEVNFEAEDTPLMIEAIPLSQDCLVLVVTKVNDPEELDTRFSNFTDLDSDELGPTLSPEERVYADEVLSCFEHLGKLLDDPLAAKLFDSESESGKKELMQQLTKIYSFASLDEVITVSKTLYKRFKGDNTLFKNPADSRYYLVLKLSGDSPENFNKICNILSEFGCSEKPFISELEFFEEHCELIIRDNAIQVLKKM